ncbi:IQ motif, EF-hand binding site [Cinara cedri]|uniref:Dynein regulatory complex protein 9 n=1 Tax=Cinara cedri TaxID=506608 RepID=A0A5E4N766_9HEMI|nr:IQ motif, EF-hand binding site [Cinara cedri]
MNQNLNDLTPINIKKFSDVFEKTLLEISILESLYGSCDFIEYLKNVFQTSIEDLHNFGTLNTLAVVSDDNLTEWKAEKNEQTLEEQHCCSNDQEFLQEYESFEKKMQILKREKKDIDSVIEKCTEIGERTIIRKETEKNYVDKWEKARVENFKFKFKAKELELQRKITKLQEELETEKIVDTQYEQFLKYSINELEKQIEYWEYKYKTDIMEIDEKLKNLMIILNEKTRKIDSLEKTYNERQIIIEEHVLNKRKLEELKKLNEHREKMATKIQAWWRGIMVRRRLGPYKNLLGPRKKSLKKPLVNKKKKTKGK